jgi:hypothetical protein
MRTLYSVALLVVVCAVPALAEDDVRVLATSRSTTMEKEMNEAADAGFRFAAVVGGDTVAGSQLVVIMTRSGAATPAYRYRVLATQKTSTMQKELQAAGDEGYAYKAQTAFKGSFSGSEAVTLLEQERARAGDVRYEYLLLATNKTSTMQRELSDAAARGYEFVGVSVGDSSLSGGDEVICILRKEKD